MSFSRQEKSLTKGSPGERRNQKERTKQALLEAAVAMAREGRPLVMSEVAEAARVSTATAYRYFPNPQSLLMGVVEERAEMAEIGGIIDGAPEDPFGRLDHIVCRTADKQFGDEALWRALAYASLERWFAQMGDTSQKERTPVRGNRRMTLTQNALGAVKGKLPRAMYRKVCAAINFVYGLDALIAARDTCHLEPHEAKEVMRWAARTLLRAALDEAGVRNV